MPITSVDPVVLRSAARRLDDAADAVTDAIARLGGLRFDGPAAGDAHVAAGWAVRAAMDALSADLSRWAGASAELAAALRAGAALHAAGEEYAQSMLR